MPFEATIIRDGGRVSFSGAGCARGRFSFPVNAGVSFVSKGAAGRPLTLICFVFTAMAHPRMRWVNGPGRIFGLPAVLEKLRTHAQERHGRAWTPAPLIEELAVSGGRFAELNS